MEIISMRQIALNGPPGNSVLIDLRKPQDYARGHIPGAINVPYENLSVREVSFDKSKKLAFYCMHGSKSMAACTRYEKLGYMTCDLRGGYSEYLRAARGRR